jgi:chaperonin GroES
MAIPPPTPPSTKPQPKLPKVDIRMKQNRVLVLPDAAEVKTKSGIIIPDTAQQRGQRGVVVAVGPGRHTDNGVLVPMGLKRGDRVVYGKFAGVTFEDDGREFLMMVEGDVLGEYGTPVPEDPEPEPAPEVLLPAE